MIEVTFNEPATAEWKKWRTKCEAAREAAIAAADTGATPEIKDSLYKEMKQVIFDAFHGKCAYCESKIAADQPGDVEHFRPKAGVTDDNDKPITLPSGKQHPGYYWLAYDWRNLIPSCNKCNRPTKGRDGKLVGKWNRFPVKDERRRWSRPDEKPDEAPFFLNPMFADPEQHFKIDETGVIGAATPEGQKCIDLLGLNRDGLIEKRQTTYLSVQAIVLMAEGAAANSAAVALANQLKQLNAYQRGELEYSFAARRALKSLKERLRPVWDVVNG
jgi:hypothetical protein